MTKKYSVEKNKQLKQLAGYNWHVDECKRALDYTDGDVEKAYQFIRKLAHGETQARKIWMEMERNGT